MGVRGSVLTVLAPALVLMLVAAACTSAPAEPEEATPSDADADGGDTTAPTADQPTAPSSPPSSATTTTGSPVEDLSTLDRDELLAVWAADRAAAVERITTAGWGLDDDGTLRGPGGMRFDTTTCPTGWVDEGPSPDGDTVPLSWWTEYHGYGPERAQVLLDWLGDGALIGGKPIEIVNGPSGEFDWEFSEAGIPEDVRVAREAELVGKVQESASVAIAVVGFQVWNGTAAIDWLFDEACLPSIGRRAAQPLREPRDGRTSPSPWIAPSVYLSYPSTGRSLAALARAHVADRPIGLLVMDNEWGLGLVEPFRSEPGRRLELVEARHDPVATSLTPEFGRLTAADPGLVVAATAGHPCRLAVAEIGAVPDPAPLLLPEFCAWPEPYILDEDLGSAELLSLRSRIDGTEESVRGTPLGDWARRSLPGPRTFISTADWAPMWQALQILQIAADLPGGMTRTNIALATWDFEGRFPLVEGPITVSWPDDVEAASSARLHRWDPDAEEWVPTEIVIDLEGS